MMIPPHHKIYPLDTYELKELKKMLTTWLDSNLVIPSNSSYGAPILFACKKIENSDFVLTIEH